MIRTLTHDDMPWIMPLVFRCHREWETHAQATTEYVRALIDSSRVIALRGEHSVVFAGISEVAWNPGERNCETIHVFSDPEASSAFEPVHLLREADKRRREIGCKRFFIVSTGADLTAFARRLGAEPCGSLHVLEGGA